MVHIGIVTQDRVPYLDVTLRSLSATKLPDDVTVTIFDDASKQATTRRYYETTKAVPVEPPWPKTRIWREELGLGIITDDPVTPVGISNKVDVVRLSDRPLGVVNASCQAICKLFDKDPNAHGIFLLQDDVVFKDDWYLRMLAAASHVRAGGHELGMLAGIKLNQTVRFHNGQTTPVVRMGVTAQCLYVTRTAYRTLLASYFGRIHDYKMRFDDMLKRSMDGAGLWAGVTYPFVCQHIGVKSLVRPGRRWEQGTKGRVGYYVHPPYALAEKVKRFKG